MYLDNGEWVWHTVPYQVGELVASGKWNGDRGNCNGIYFTESLGTIVDMGERQTRLEPRPYATVLWQSGGHAGKSMTYDLDHHFEQAFKRVKDS